MSPTCPVKTPPVRPRAQPLRVRAVLAFALPAALLACDGPEVSGEVPELARTEAEAATPSVADPADDPTAPTPPSPRFDSLQDAIQHYEQILADGGWPTVPPGPTLDPGQDDPRVERLRERLAVSGELSAADARSPSSPEHYDGTLEVAVRAFQRTHGLEVDGRVGAATLVQLNVSARERLRQLRLNADRQAAFAPEPGGDYLLVNIPAFMVRIFEAGEESMRLRAIVGQRGRPTPTFSARMTYLVLAPYWQVPPGIASRDQLPRIRNDLSYLQREGMVLLDQNSGQRVDPTGIEWESLTGAEFNRHYRIRQAPGPRNAMGDVKFMFPNQHNVYLHDTPNRELFGEARRAFSSGCVRVDRARELAGYLLRDAPDWSPERIREVIAAGREQRVNLPAPVPIYIEYWTAFVDDDGTLNFREDIYRRDVDLPTTAAAGEVREADTGTIPCLVFESEEG
ncbi:MAG: L,D-transpeptidase family protein [Gemmatimonadota bacterium]